MGEETEARPATLSVVLPDPADGERLFGENGLEVRQTADLRWLQDRDAIQSIMDRADPTRLVLSTHHAMTAAFLLTHNAAHVLNLGAGAGSFERFLRAVYPQTRLTSVEYSSRVTRLAAEFFEWPAELDVHQIPAADFMRNPRSEFDVVLIDLFEDKKNAACLYDNQFFEDLNGSVRDGGALALNVIPDGQADLIALLLPLRRSFPHVWLSETSNHSNVVLVASKRPVARQLKNLSSAAPLGERFALPMEKIAAGFTALPGRAR